VAAQVPQQVAQEVADLRAPNVVRVDLVVQVQPVTLGTDRQAGDDREAIVSVAVLDDWRLPAGRPSGADAGDQEEARFVREDDVGPQFPGVFFTRSQSSPLKRAILASSRWEARRLGFW
jgi:hypothetical protein